MQNGTPEVYPANKLKVVWCIRLTLYDIKDGFVKNRDGTGDTRNAKWLSTEDRKNECSHK